MSSEAVVESGVIGVQQSWSTETEAGSMATTLQTLETSSFTVYENVDSGKIEYTPEEIRCNDWMMQMEGEAMERVNQEAIDAHSTALQ